MQAESDHRRRAITEQVHADLKNGPLPHLLSGKFAANSAWRVLAAMAFNLLRAAGSLASLTQAEATTMCHEHASTTTNACTRRT